MNMAIAALHRLGGEAVLQWRVLAVLQAVLSIWLVQESQQDPSLTLLAVVVWGGAVICVEDQLEDLQVRPSRSSLVAGFALLAYATWRSAMVLDLDSIVFVLPLLQGLGLAMLARPVRQIINWSHALVVLALFPLQLLIVRLVPEYWLSVVTGRVSQIYLLFFGINSFQSGRDLKLADGGVRIAESCNGVDLIVQVMIIAIIFVLAFPIKGLGRKILYVAAAPLVGFLVNACRISILAVINSSSLPFRKQVFDFIHEDWGSFVFAGVAIIVIGQVYMFMVDSYLASRQGSGRNG